jgi:hypothetical protein
MRSLRITHAAMFAVALTTTGSLVVLAQDADPKAPRAVLGWALDETHFADGENGEVDGVLQRRGSTYTYRFESDDPRLSGTAVWTGSGDRYQGDPGFEVQTATWSLENPDGLWAGQGTGIQGPGLAESDVIVLTGSGAYDGLSAYLMMDWGYGGGRFRGAVFPGEMPPLP